MACLPSFFRTHEPLDAVQGYAARERGPVTSKATLMPHS